ncbi:hypothetical protein KGM_210695 [Danaus plexippus plexippus]|uniref:Uncharacterized protein n=1 Tax=Danaus plexippus plexippus TaxID=278856 RepID=A0A212EHL9_DANPL|nr:hypothetical protein KGM_210695 [Danaus plexippus plexippus]
MDDKGLRGPNFTWCMEVPLTSVAINSGNSGEEGSPLSKEPEQPPDPPT